MNNMKIHALKDKLSALGLNTRGNKSALIERLLLASDSDEVKTNVNNDINKLIPSESNCEDLYNIIKQLKTKNSHLCDEITKLKYENTELLSRISKYEPVNPVIDPSKKPRALTVNEAPPTPQTSSICPNQEGVHRDLTVTTNQQPLHMSDLGRRKPADELTKTSKNVLILSDDYGRGIGPLFHNNLSNYNVNSIFKPNAKINEIITDVKNLTKKFNFNDFVIIIGGANDFMYKTNPHTFSKTFRDIRNSLNYTNVIISSIPYNIKFGSLNNSIYKLNKYLSNLCEDNFNFYFFDINSITNLKLYTNDNTHINYKGKKLIVTSLINVINSIIHTNSLNTISNIPVIINNNLYSNNVNFWKRPKNLDII